MDHLSISIKKTLSFFDLLDRPLTTEELYSFLWQPPFLSYADFKNKLLTGGEVTSKNGLNYLLNKGDLSEISRNSAVIQDDKMRVAIRGVKFLRYVPFVRAVFVCNSIGFFSAKKESDVDFFIVTAPGRVWLTRLFCNILLRLRGIRVYGKKSQDKICLSFFIDENHLDLSALRIREDDVYLAYWLYHLIPIFDKNNISGKILKQNDWLRKFLPNAVPEISISPWGVSDNFLSKMWKNFWEISWQGSYGDTLEKTARDIQENKIKKTIRGNEFLDGKRIVFNDTMVKLHLNDSRQNIYDAWKKRYE